MFILLPLLGGILPPVDPTHPNFGKNYRFIQKAFLGESGPLADFTSNNEFVGEEHKFKWSDLFKSATYSSTLKTEQAIHLAGTLRGRKIETTVSISSTYITNIDFIARLPKKIPCEAGIEKKFLKGYVFTAADNQFAEQLNKASLLRKSVNAAINKTYKENGLIGDRVTITPSFALAPEGEGNTVIWLRTAPKSIWWTLWLFKEFGFQKFYDVVEAVDQAL